MLYLMDRDDIGLRSRDTRRLPRSPDMSEKRKSQRFSSRDTCPIPREIPCIKMRLSSFRLLCAKDSGSRRSKPPSSAFRSLRPAKRVFRRPRKTFFITMNRPSMTPDWLKKYWMSFKKSRIPIGCARFKRPFERLIRH